MSSGYTWHPDDGDYHPVFDPPAPPDPPEDAEGKGRDAEASTDDGNDDGFPFFGS